MRQDDNTIHDKLMQNLHRLASKANFDNVSLIDSASLQVSCCFPDLLTNGDINNVKQAPLNYV